MKQSRRKLRLRKLPLSPGHVWPIFALSAAGVLFSGVLFRNLKMADINRRQTALLTAANQRMELLREAVGNSLETLHALGSLYAAEGTVSRRRFHIFVSGALARHPELQALSWTPRVPANQRHAFVDAARAAGYPQFDFTERDPATGQTVPEPSRNDAYYPVYYIEPLKKNRAAFGFDLNARWATLAQARDSEKATATPPIRLVQEKFNEPGFIVYLPLYGGLNPTTVADRQRENTGFVAAVFRIADLVGPALARRPGLRVSVTDQTGDGSDIKYAAPAASGAPVDPSLSSCRFELPLANRTWQITFRPTTVFAGGANPWPARGALAAGLLVTGLLAGYLLTGLRQNAETARSNAALQTEIADRKRAERDAASANRAKSDFLASLSHEIRTPLNSILGYTQILERDQDFPVRHRDAVSALANSGRHLLGLLNSILDLSKIEANRMELQREVFDLPTLVRSIAEMFKPNCRDKRIELRVHTPDTGESPVLGDEGKLRQVLINLIGNAVKFTPRGEVIVGLTRTDTNHWLFDIMDTGIGLNQSEREGLFAPFHQTRAGRRFGGTGLGLALSRGYVELMGGRLEIQSEPGTGTRFFFTLQLPAAAAVPVSLSQLPRLESHHPVKALIVDDNRDNRAILCRLLADIGCRVAAADGSETAHDICRQEAPDIVFLDILLTEITGPKLLQKLRLSGLPESVPAVFHTAALLDARQRSELLASGADLLSKPFRIDDLCACLLRVPGVRFIEAEPVAPSLPQPIDFDNIVLPETLCNRMCVAAELHSTTVLKGCLEELRQMEGPAAALSEHLRQLLRAYDLAAISRLLNQLRIHVADTANAAPS